MKPHTPSQFQPWLRLVLGVLGAASFGAGVAAVFMSKDGPGAGVLIGFGRLVLVAALLGDAIEASTSNALMLSSGFKREVMSNESQPWPLCKQSQARATRS